jgi:ribosomal protein S18 acetylase RimI-like enzyme
VAPVSIERVRDDRDGSITELFVQYRHFYDRRDEDDAARAFFRQRLHRGDSLVWAAYSDDGVADGFVQVYVHHSSLGLATDWVLNDLFVAQSGRGKGVGKGLVVAVVDEARADGARLVELETRHDNTTARALYESLGFSLRSPEPDAGGFVTYELRTG